MAHVTDLKVDKDHDHPKIIQLDKGEVSRLRRWIKDYASLNDMNYSTWNPALRTAITRMAVDANERGFGLCDITDVIDAMVEAGVNK